MANVSRSKGEDRSDGGGPAVGDAAVRRATGRSWAEWFALLDRWGAKRRGHKHTARYLAQAQGLSLWWSQMVTVSYEKDRGLKRLFEARG